MNLIIIMTNYENLKCIVIVEILMLNVRFENPFPQYTFKKYSKNTVPNISVIIDQSNFDIWNSIFSLFVRFNVAVFFIVFLCTIRKKGSTIYFLFLLPFHCH